MNRHIFISCLLFFISFFFAVSPASAQQVISPQVYCLGSCPTGHEPLKEISPQTIQQKKEIPSPALSQQSMKQSPVVSVDDPCETVTIQHYNNHHQKRDHGSLSDFITFLKQLIALLLELLGGNSSTLPKPIPTPTEKNLDQPTEPCDIATQPTRALVANPTTAPTVVAATVAPVQSTHMTLISRSVPAVASSGTASESNDDNYNISWQSQNSPSWLAYDLSAIPATKRTNVLLVWYNEETEAYDPALANEPAINYPKNYTIETNTAPGGTLPTTGWVTKATITNNKYHSRQHVFDMTGAHWVRITITGVTGGTKPSFAMDMYDVSAGVDDDWIIYGSSTPAMSMSHESRGSTKLSFSEMINQTKPDYFPVQENGAISGLDTNDGVQHIDEWLALFPGKYVGLALGANDADECMNAQTFYNNFVTMINKVTASGKIPVIPTPNWSKAPNVQKCGPAIVEQINKIYTNYPQVVKGPDLWTYFKAHPELIGSDGQHPTTEGQGAYRQLWAETALQTVYK